MTALINPCPPLRPWPWVCTLDYCGPWCPAGSRPSATRIIADVAKAHGFTSDQLRARGKTGGNPIYEARREVARRLRNEWKLPLRKIGQYLGGRHHTVILRMIDEEYRQKTMRKASARFPAGWRRKAAA